MSTQEFHIRKIGTSNRGGYTYLAIEAQDGTRFLSPLSTRELHVVLSSLLDGALEDRAFAEKWPKAMDLLRSARAELGKDTDSPKTTH